MSTTKWTNAQESAINTRGKTLLVSAAAGSGKTATLTERIIKSITRKEDPADLSRMLIVTYTRAAATDLKTKISKALADAIAKDPSNRHLASQIMLLGSAHISTIDSFYYDVLKSNFNKLSIPGNLRIADTAEVALLYRAVMEDTIDDFYEKNLFEDFADHFADLRSTDRLGDIFISIYEDLLPFRKGIDLLLHYEAQLLESTSRDFFDTPYGKAAHAEIAATLSYIQNILLTAVAHLETDERLVKSYLPSFHQDLRYVSRALELTEQKNYEAVRETLLEHAPIKPKGFSGVDAQTKQFVSMRAKAQKLLKELKAHFFTFSGDEIREHMKVTAHICRQAHVFLTAFDTALAKEKLSRGICDFSDVRRFVLKLLVDENDIPTALAEDLKEQFDEIYIDEYQDTDEVQDRIFQAIAKPNNRFMVGDIKQSIYSFRGAAPSIFAEYKRSMPGLDEAEAEACSIFMSNNFRCDENIIRFSNLVSSYLFRNCGKSIEYSEKDDLIFSKKPPFDGYTSPKVVLALTGIAENTADGDDEDEENEQSTETDSEWAYIVQEIKRLIATEKKADGSPIRPRDIAILMRKKKNMAELMERLQNSGIPACSSMDRDFFENPDVLLILSLLSTIDNPQKDIPLAGTLCSPFYSFTLEDLVVLRENGSQTMSLYDALECYGKKNEDALAQKCMTFLDSLSYWRMQAQALPVDKLLRKLYREFSVLSMQGTTESNLTRLYEYARGFESGGFRGLYGFVRYLNEIIASGTKMNNGEGDADVDAVHLMTVHHSKGLEFPVCFICEAAKEFSTRFKRDKIQFEPSVGIGFVIHDESGMGYYDTPIRQAVINEESRLMREEEMRILYVAMTRARERLYVTAKIKDPDKKREAAKNLVQFGNTFGIIKAQSYLEWILAAIADAGEASPLCECLTVQEIHEGDPQKELPVCAPPRAVEATHDSPDETVDQEILALLEQRFAFRYPFEHVSNLPAKLSVSKLYPAILDEEDDLLSLQDLDEENNFLEDAFALPDRLDDRSRISAADRGTATHTFLQFCDFDHVLQAGVEEELTRLTALNFITLEMASMVNVKQLEAFFQSVLFERIKKARRVWREQRFNLFLPASEFTEDPEKAELLKEETIAVQGVIDLFFEDENGNIVLCDYKTDYLTREELSAPPLAAEKLEKRHRQQLSYYAKALEAMMGRAPSEVLIYSLPLADSVKVSFSK